METTQRTFMNRDSETGEITEKSYSVKGPTLNDMLTEDLEGTIEFWVEEGFEKIEPDKFKYVGKGKYVKYVTTGGKVRVGGILMVKQKDYFVLRNMTNAMSWSIQLNKTRNMYVRDDTSPLSREKEMKDRLKESNKEDFIVIMNKEYSRLFKIDPKDKIITSQLGFYNHMKSINDNTKRTWTREFIQKKKPLKEKIKKTEVLEVSN